MHLHCNKYDIFYQVFSIYQAGRPESRWLSCGRQSRCFEVLLSCKKERDVLSIAGCPTCFVRIRIRPYPLLNGRSSGKSCDCERFSGSRRFARQPEERQVSDGPVWAFCTGNLCRTLTAWPDARETVRPATAIGEQTRSEAGRPRTSMCDILEHTDRHAVSPAPEHCKTVGESSQNHWCFLPIPDINRKVSGRPFGSRSQGQEQADVGAHADDHIARAISSK